MIRLGTVLPAATFGILLALPAASIAREVGFYLGGGVGYHRLNEDNFDDRRSEFDEAKVGYRGFAGLRLHRFFGLEGSYVDFGTADDGQNRLDAHGFTGAAIGFVPLTPAVDLYGKLGVLSWDKSGRRNRTASSPLDFDEDGQDAFFGLGAGFGLNQSLALKLEYERYKMDQTDVDLASVNLQFNF